MPPAWHSPPAPARCTLLDAYDIFDPRKSLCPNQNCITALGGVSIYRDASHIAASQIGILEGDMEQVLR